MLNYSSMPEMITDRIANLCSAFFYLSLSASPRLDTHRALDGTLVYASHIMLIVAIDMLFSPVDLNIGTQGHKWTTSNEQHQMSLELKLGLVNLGRHKVFSTRNGTICADMGRRFFFFFFDDFCVSIDS